MTTTPLTGPPEAPARPPQRARRRWRRPAIAAAVLVLAGATAGWLRYAATYQPLAVGSSGGPRSGNVATLTDGILKTAYIVRGATGAQGTVTYSIHNDGRFAVRLLGYADPSDPRVRMRWAPEFTPDGPVGGDPSDVRPFPVTVPAGGSVELWVTVAKPRCPQGSGAYYESLAIRWQALGVHHVYVLRLHPDEGGWTLPIAVCFPRSALRHIER